MGLFYTNYRCPKCGYDHEFDNKDISKALNAGFEFLPTCNDCSNITVVEGKEIYEPVVMVKFDFKNNSQSWKWND